MGGSYDVRSGHLQTLRVESTRPRYGRPMATGPLALSFVRSYVDIDALPFVNAEVALVGRSNVGKSSLLNALAQRKNLAKTSKTPSATRS